MGRTGEPICILNTNMLPCIIIGTPKKDSKCWKTLTCGNFWVAVKELKLSYYVGETLLIPVYTQYGNLICRYIRVI